MSTGLVVGFGNNVMDDTCINNTIQRYMEELITKLKLTNTEKLYDMYKEVRVEMAANGMISLRDSTKCMTNPKSIAAALVYIWVISNREHGVTQRDIAAAAGITESTITANYRLLTEWFNSKGIRTIDETY